MFQGRTYWIPSGSSGSSGSSGPSGLPADSSAGPDRTGRPGEAEALRAECSQLLADVSEMARRPQDILLAKASRTGTGRLISNLAGCSSVPWLRTTRDRLVEMRLQCRLKAVAEEASTEDPGPPLTDAAAQEVWDRAVLALDLAPHVHETWLAPAKAIGVGEGRLRVWVPSEVHVSWIRDSWGERLSGLLAPLVLRLVHGGLVGTA